MEENKIEKAYNKEENINKKDSNDIKKDYDYYDLTDQEDIKVLNEELNSCSNYFKPDNNITYKVNLTSPIIKTVKKEWKGDIYNKYAINIKSISENGIVFEGLWEVGKFILSIIAKNYDEKAAFKVTKTGFDKETRYNIIKDF